LVYIRSLVLPLSRDTVIFISRPPDSYRSSPLRRTYLVLLQTTLYPSDFYQLVPVPSINYSSNITLQFLLTHTGFLWYDSTFIISTSLPPPLLVVTLHRSLRHRPVSPYSFFQGFFHDDDLLSVSLFIYFRNYQ
jgi:hypothetical protein